MKKEVIIAIVLGVVIGLIITFGVHRAQQSLRNREVAQQIASPQSNGQAVPENQDPHSLILYEPNANDIYDQDEIEVSGITTENSLIAVIRDSQYSTTYADNQGSFATTVSLRPGANRIIVRSHSLTGSIASASADIVYSTADLDLSPTPTTTNDDNTEDEQ